MQVLPHENTEAAHGAPFKTPIVMPIKRGAPGSTATSEDSLDEGSGGGTWTQVPKSS